MFRPVDTRDTAAVEREARLVYGALYPRSDPSFVSTAFGWVLQCFEGRHAGWLPLDTPYHDTEHTMQGALCLVRLLASRTRAGAAPVLTQRSFELGLLAMLFHDTGYLKRADDVAGTGAKYTATHVNRSASFAGAFLKPRGFAADEIAAIQSMVHCTCPYTDPATIPFHGELERIVGFAVGTSDLLGQMAAPDYVDKLPVLFGEFAEAARTPVPSLPSAYKFASSLALMRDTPAFWRDFVVPRIDGKFERMYRFLRDPYPDGPNPYVDAVERNLGILRARLESAA